MKTKRTKPKSDDPFTVIMDRIQLRIELKTLIARYGRDKVSKALSLLLQGIVRKAKP